MECCERLSECPFFKAVHEDDEIKDVLKEYMRVYCCGPFKGDCYRIHYLKKFDKQPKDTISPTGLDYKKYI